jgi:hypothetical protein
VDFGKHCFKARMMQNRSLFLGIGIGLFGTLAVLTVRYVTIVCWRAEGESEMKLGPRPNGRPWTPEEDALLLALLESKMDRDLISQKLKRTVSAITGRLRVLRAAGVKVPK